MFDEATAANPVNVRDVKFVITRLSDLDDTYAVEWILDHLSEVPYLASRLVPYLQTHVAQFDIESRLRDFIKDQSQNLYPHTELHVLRLYARADELEEETYNLCGRSCVTQIDPLR